MTWERDEDGYALLDGGPWWRRDGRVLPARTYRVYVPAPVVLGTMGRGWEGDARALCGHPGYGMWALTEVSPLWSGNINPAWMAVWVDRAAPTLQQAIDAGELEYIVGGPSAPPREEQRPWNAPVYATSGDVANRARTPQRGDGMFVPLVSPHGPIIIVRSSQSQDAVQGWMLGLSWYPGCDPGRIYAGA